MRRATSSMRNRIKELRQVRAGDLQARSRATTAVTQNVSARQWRRRSSRLGYVNAVVARETADGLVLVDGHLRAGLDPDQVIPVLVVDLDESQRAGRHWPPSTRLAAMAENDKAAWDLPCWPR